MQISPKFSMYLNIVIAIAGALAAMSPSAFPSYVPSTIASNIIQTCGFVFAIYGIVNAALHGASAPTAGPLAGKIDPKRVASALALFLVVSMVAGSLAACAQLKQAITLTPDQRASLQAETAFFVAAGKAGIQIWCAASGIVYVIARDESGNSTGKFVTGLANNAQAAADACPMIAQVTGVSAAAAPPAGAIQSPITAKGG